MRRKFIFILCSALLFVLNSLRAQQTIQLYYEDFDGGSTSFDLNNTTGLGSNTGTNQWIINNSYDGNGLYPDTPDETQTFSGTIAGAPYSNYLHINDANTSAAANASYDPNSASDRVAAMNTGFCTLAMTDVTFTFFYLCEGNADDYGALYYSIDGGATWIQTGQSQYNNTSLWKYEAVTNSAFDNQIDLRFAFRWVNGTGAAESVSFSIDDIIVVGTYDDVNNPVTIDITSISPNPVCQGSYLSIFFELSEPLCDGTYEIEMSNAAGSFASPLNLGVFTVFANQTTGGVGIQIPSSTLPGGCYEVRINRVSPPPAITGTVSICFEVEECPNVITTLQPAVTFGPDTLCTHSVIDVPFYSTGVYSFNNQYVAELSDANGSFLSPQTLGSSFDANAYDPLLGSPPGSVSGLVPTTAPGCNYYVRVISTNPATIGSSWGPFCIHNCDVTTNNMEDVAVCITENTGVDTTIVIDIDTWGSGVTYGPGNQFQVQVLDISSYSILNTGTLGTVNSTTSGSLTLSIPGLSDLIPILGSPGYGIYYMRIVSTDVTPSSQSYGSLIHLTIGFEDTIPPLLTADDTLICAGDYLTLTFSPYREGSQYEWFSPNLNGGIPFFWPGSGIIIGFPSNFPTGTYWFTVREYNYGCYSPWADTVFVNIIATPSTGIVGPISVCAGDTINYNVPFFPGTYYEWSSTWGDIIDTSNNEITVVFDSSGTVTLSVFALNECGSGSGTKVVQVHPLPDVTAPPDTIVCPGAPVVLNAISSAPNVQWIANNVLVSSTNPITVNPLENTPYTAQAISSFSCYKMDTVLVNVFPGIEATVSSLDVLCSGEANGQAAANPGGGVAPFTYEWNTLPTNDSALISGLAPGNYMVIITDVNGCLDSAMVTIIEPPSLVTDLTSTAETYYNAHDGSATVSPSGGTPPYSYDWNSVPPQNTATATGLSTGWYKVEVTDANGCKIIDSVYVETTANTLAVPNAFTPNGDGLNDFFQIAQINVATLKMKVFNRWGQLVFTGTDIMNGWDGQFNGKPEEDGVYVYEVHVTYLDGLAETRKGNVTLLR